MLSSFTCLSALVLALTGSASAQAIAAQVAALRNAATEVDRLQLLNDTDVSPFSFLGNKDDMNSALQFLFDFNNPPAGSVNAGSGGHTVQARSDNFAAIVGKNIAMSESSQRSVLPQFFPY